MKLNTANTLYLAQPGEAYGIAGQPGEAREVLRQLEELGRQRYVSPYHLAYVYTVVTLHPAAVTPAVQGSPREDESGVTGANA